MFELRDLRGFLRKPRRMIRGAMLEAAKAKPLPRTNRRLGFRKARGAIVIGLT